MEVLSLIESHVMQIQACPSVQPLWWQQGVIYQVYRKGPIDLAHLTLRGDEGCIIAVSSGEPFSGGNT